MKRAGDTYGLGVGAEIRWKDSDPRKPKKAKRERTRRVIVKKARPGVPTGSRPTCPELVEAPVLPRRFVCAVCADRLDKKSAEHRERHPGTDAES